MTILKLNTVGVQAPEPPTARTSDDNCNQTWREKGISGYAAFGIFRRLWQTLALENMLQFWPIYAVSSEDFCTNKILSLKIMQSIADIYGLFA